MNPTFAAYAALAGAIVLEVTGSTLLQKSAQYTKLLPTVGMLVCYGAAFYLLSLALKVVPLGVTYAIWAGVGIVLTALVGTVVFRQALDAAALIGIAMIVGGVVVMQAFSATTRHSP